MLSVLGVRGTPHLIAATLLGRLPQAMCGLAVVRLVRDQGGSYAVAGSLVATFTIASTFGQPLWSRRVDRTGEPRYVLTGAATGAALALFAFAVSPSGWWLLHALLLAIAGFCTPPLEPVLRSLWPQMMKPGYQLRAAFSLDAATQEIIFVLGPLLTTLGIGVFGVRGNIAAMGVLTAVGTYVFVAHRRLRSQEVDGEAGGNSPLRRRDMRRLLFASLFLPVPVGALTISASHAAERLSIDDFASWALALNAAGALVGASLSSRMSPPRNPARTIAATGVAMAIAFVPTSVDWPTGLWLVAAFLSGLPFAILFTQIFLQTERIVPASELNEANAWVVSAVGVGIAAGTLLAGIVVDASDGTGVGKAVVLASIASSAGALIMFRDRNHSAPVRPSGGD